MGSVYQLSYDSYVEPVASDLVRADPEGAWQVIRRHLEATLPKWRVDLLHWLKGGHPGSDDFDYEVIFCATCTMRLGTKFLTALKAVTSPLLLNRREPKGRCVYTWQSATNASHKAVANRLTAEWSR